MACRKWSLNTFSKKNGINPQKDLSINQSIDFGSTAAAFSGAQADYTIEFEPMPEMVFEYILKKNGINPQKDLSINQSIDFGSTAAAFSGGQADYTIEFEPSATALEAENSGYVVASLGVDSGYVPYTAYSAKTSYLNANPNIIQKFTNALQKGMDFVQSHTPEEIAKVIAPQFKETDLATITTIVSRYYEQDTWKSDLIFNEESFNLLQDILENSGELKERVPYEELVTTTFAEKAAH